jgi:hypothetical protein
MIIDTSRGQTSLTARLKKRAFANPRTNGQLHRHDSLSKTDDLTELFRRDIAISQTKTIIPFSPSFRLFLFKCALSKKIGEFSSKLISCFHINIKVGNKPNYAITTAKQNTARCEMCPKRVCRPFGDRHKQHICLNQISINRDRSNVVQLIGKSPRHRMIIGKPVNMVIKCINACRRQNANLTHATANQFAHPARPRNKIMRANKN